MVVMKFGGSSVADAARMRHVAEIVKTQLIHKPALVLSAMGESTDYLLEAGNIALKQGKVEIENVEKLHITAVKALKLPIQKEINALLDELKSLLTGIALIKELTPRTKDYLLSFGERLSVRIAAAYFQTVDIKAKAFDAYDLGFLSDSNYGNAELTKESWKLIPAKILPLIKNGILPVVTGFIAKDTNGSITTLGRGGSDLTATMIGAACKAKEIQVRKDVDGVLTAVPRLVKNARIVRSITYEEASELAYYGAQVLHPRAMQPCIKTGTPVVVKNSYNIDAAGTQIIQNQPSGKKPVRTITFRKNVTLVDIVSTRMVGQFGFLEQVFSVFAKHSISVDMVATSEVSISLTIDSGCDLSEVKKELGKIAKVEIKTGKAIVTLIGDVKRSSEILARTFRICQLIGVTVQMISQGASKVNISFIVNDTEAPEVVKAVHQDFFEE